jgi:hypothetical protein
VKYLKRGEGQVEKQYRYNCGDLPVLYKSEEKGRYIYVMEGAVTAFSGADNGAYIGKESAGGDEIMVPPCIQVRVGHRSTCCDLVLAFRRVGGTSAPLHANATRLRRPALSKPNLRCRPDEWGGVLCLGGIYGGP